MRQTTDTQTKITLSPRAKAQIEKSFIERTIAEAWREVEGEIPCYEGWAEFAVDALDQAGFAIVAKPQPGSTAHDRVELARRTGCWDGVSDKDYMTWARSLVPGAFVIRTVEELTTENKKAWAAVAEALDRDKGVPTDRVLEVVYAKPDGTTETVRHAEVVRTDAVSYDPPPVVGGTVAKATVLCATETVTPEPERDDLGLRPWSADDLAARYGCRVEISDVDNAHVPLSVEHGEGGYVVVTERATGRVVGIVEAWRDEDGDVLVPHAWLSTVLSAWDAARDPHLREHAERLEAEADRLQDDADRMTEAADEIEQELQPRGPRP